MPDDPEDSEDILNDSLAFLGGSPVIDEESIHYGPLILTVAPKEGKANTLLADHLFSPALFLAERIERQLIPVEGRTVIELGAGCALPSLLMATVSEPPSLVVVTDYPDDVILGNLKKNVARNQGAFISSCRVECYGYEWGQAAQPLLNLMQSDISGYDIVILSDLLHFHSSHDALVASLTSLLAKSRTSRAYIAAGTYTHPHVCDNFLRLGMLAGLSFEEVLQEANGGSWLGRFQVSGLDEEQLTVRKAMCRLWIGRWAENLE